MESTAPSNCPNPTCRQLLATTGRLHCDVPHTRSKPCGWLICTACKTVIDIRTGMYTPRSAA